MDRSCKGSSKRSSGPLISGRRSNRNLQRMVICLLLQRTCALSLYRVKPLHSRISPLVTQRRVGQQIFRHVNPRFASSAVAQDLDDPETSPRLLLGGKSRPFQVTAPYEPTGDQPQAIQQLIRQLEEGDKFSILRGITGTGKTFVMSHVIAKWGRPTLVLCHNKTLAAQLARELRSFLSHNAVELFVSYYDHYVPESFVETTGKYIAKKSSVNDEIDALRHRATRALLERRDVVVVASVSCIYGLGLPAEYLDASTNLSVGDHVSLPDLVEKLEIMLYTRPESEDMLRGNYQLSASMNGDTVTHVLSLWPPHERFPVRIEFWTGDTVTRVKSIMVTEQGLIERDSLHIFPAKHHVVSEQRLEEACINIEQEMKDQVAMLTAIGKLVEAQRLQQRVLNDLLMLRETGFCSGVENYSRHFAGRAEGDPPDTLMDYLKLSGDGDWLLVVDESHVSLPQLKAMYAGDRSRKQRLVKHGYRLPSALDNRPLRHDEFWDQISKAVFVSATPARQEMDWTKRAPVNMVIRPTFVCDPVIHVRSPVGQLDDLVSEIRTRATLGERTLAIALTKRDAEDLASYLMEQGISSTFIHSGLTTHERSDALKSLQKGEIDCLVGVNLLREGLDLPQVSLVAVLNADSEGFLRSETSLLQTVGRAARNLNGTAVFYAKRITQSMQKCIDDTEQRRQQQLTYNRVNGFKSISTKGSTMMSIFDLLRDEIQDEQALELIGPRISRELNKIELGEIISVALPLVEEESGASIVTDHLPSKPGVYFWKDSNGGILYIGKAKKLRSRVKSYLSSGAKHSPRIKVMLSKAAFVEFVITPSDRDALILESNLIKHHQPPYNVLLKDDEAYPYICASVGDAFPRFFAAPRKQAGENASRYRYFGPYPHFNEINAVLQGIEETYDLRGMSFAARHGTGSKETYNELFNSVLVDVFEAKPNDDAPSSSLPAMRSEFEEANLLFDSIYNRCRDVVAVGCSSEDDGSAIVHVLQLRNGLVAGRFSYACQLATGKLSDDDFAAAIQAVLERQHYPSGEAAPSGRFTFFPEEILIQYPIANPTELKQMIRSLRNRIEPGRKDAIRIRTQGTGGRKKETDARAMEFAVDNAQQVALETDQRQAKGATKTSVDGTAMKELMSLLSLEKAPNRIECYDISHTQGDVAVGSRVVFIGGKPARHLYRRFNIKTVHGVNDYACLEEVLERRFRRVWLNNSGGTVHEDDPWSLPDLVVIDGGLGQLSAALKGMAKAHIFPKSNQVTMNDETGAALDDDEIFEEILINESEGKGSATTVAICSIAKNEEELFVHGINRPINDFPDSPALLLLRSLRDESHRFALDAHRKRRSSRNGLS